MQKFENMDLIAALECEMLSATVITGAVGAALYKARLLPETEKKSEKVVKTAEV